MPIEHPLQIVSFASELGWIAAVGAGATIKQLVFGYPSRAAAWHALDATFAAQAQAGNWWPSLVERLREYAAGGRVDFRGVSLDLDHLTPFQRRIVKHCRAVPYGQTCSYGELAAKSGSPRAARAVGNTMALNRFPILVPCHRVIHSNGSIGSYSYSGPDGPQMKIRLLSMERRDASGPWFRPAEPKRRRTPLRV